jgi:hypothetical protein
MKSELEGLNRTIKEFLHNDGYKNIPSMDPWGGLRQLETNKVLGSNPVHIKKEHLKCLVERVKITLSKLSPKRRRDRLGVQSGPSMGSGGDGGIDGGGRGGVCGGPARGGGGGGGRGSPLTLLQDGTASEEAAEATTVTAVAAADSEAAAVEAGEGQWEAEWPNS